MKMKKTLALILAFAMIMSTMSFTALADVAEPETPENIEYGVSVLSEGEYPTENWIDEADTSWYDGVELADGDTYVIDTAAELAGLAKLVNDGVNFKNKTITLTADVDLNQIDWTPIGGGENGRCFTGTFDGGNKTISNLWVASSYSSIGLFGYIGATETGKAIVKNLVINNATVINQSGDGVGAVVGSSGTDGEVNNVTVTGELAIYGYRGVAAVVGKGYADINNCTVEATGTIASRYWCAGGIIGHSDEPCVTISNCKVIGTGDGIVIDGGSYNGAGGIGGYVAGGSGSVVENCTVANATIDGDNYYYGGYICGNGKESVDCVIEDVSFCVNGAPADNAHDAGIVAAVVAKIGETPYYTLQEAVNSASEGDVISVIGTVAEGSVKLPATLKNITIAGNENAVLKNTVLKAADGNSIDYDGVTIQGLTFDNSHIVMTGWRTGGASYKNIVIDSNVFKNLDNTTSEAVIHLNLAAHEAVNGLTVTNNVIEQAAGGSKSGIYAQVTGDAVVKDNVINNVAFRPFVIQLTTDDGVADSLVVEGNTFSGSSAGRLQALGNNSEGTDSVNLVVTNNILSDITNAQQICYWNFNEATTTTEFSRNYYDIDIKSNPEKFYYNVPASSAEDLVEMGIYPYYENLNTDGEIDLGSLVTAKDIAVAMVGDDGYMTLKEAFDAAEESDEIVLYKNAVVDEVITTDKSLVLNLNGKTITAADTVVASRMIVLGDGCTEFILNANGGKIVSEGAESYGIFDVNTAATLTVNGGTYDYDTNNGSLFKFRAFDNKIVLNNVNVETNGQISGPNNSGNILDVNGGTFKATNGYNVRNIFAFYVENTIATFDDVVMDNEYIGGIECWGGEATLTNCDITVMGTNSAPYLSTAVAVSGMGEVNVISGNYKTEPLAASDANGQGTTHGSWTGIIMSSGGTMNINGGTFSNGNYGDDALATNPREVLSVGADTKYGDNVVGTFNIAGGTFNSLGSAIACETIWDQDGDGLATAAIDINISGGEFLNCTKTIGGCDPISTPNPVTVDITGGLFAENVGQYADYVEDGYRVTPTGLGYYSVDATAVSTDAISIVYREDEAKRTEEAKVYDIIVKAEAGDVINELASVDLSFVYAPTAVGDGNITFTVLPADKFTMTKHEDTVKYPERYMFNYNGVDAVEGSGNELVVGTITVEGFGSYKISTADVATNIVNATTLNDNLVDSYTAAGATDSDATTGELIINPDVEGKIDDAITVPVRELAVNITFPNTVVNNEVIYQNMTVTIVGGNYTEEIALGTDGEGYSFTRELPYNTTYMVTVEGAGYRTARYAVTLTENKTLNFWNNVMDNKLEVEVGKANSAVNHNFLAGDIVKDNNINIYDLSAVVAYFGTEGLSATSKPEYAKYDLNRDGVIDSKDVAYVLVSWNN